MLTEDESFEFFWRGQYSQWYPSSFIVDEITYGCAEQYMMASKAKLFHDDEIFNEIMAVKIVNHDDSKEIKALGKRVHNFDANTWLKYRYTIVLSASMAKYTQNKPLKDLLISTGLKTLVEASPLDRVWGIGLASNDPRAMHRSEWKGLNLLGQALTQTRENIKWIEYNLNKQ